MDPWRTISQKNKGMNAIRIAESALGTVRIADDARSELAVPLIGRAGRIRTADLLTPSQTR